VHGSHGWPPSLALGSRGPKAQHICVALCCVAPPSNGRPFLLFTARHHPSDPSIPSIGLSTPPASHEYRRPRPFPRFLLILLLSPPPLPSVTPAGGGARGRSNSTAMAAVKVDKATNELLLGPDWTLNIDICDAVNSDHGYIFLSPSSFSSGRSVLNSWFLCHRNNGERFVFLARFL